MKMKRFVDRVIKINLTLLISLSITSLLSRKVAAINKDIDFTEFAANAGELLHRLISNDYSLFFLLFIIVTVLFKSIYGALIKKVKIFEGGGGEGISRPGEVLSWTLSLLTTTSMAYAKGDASVSDFIGNILGPFGFYGIIAGTALAYLGYKNAFESHPMALLLSGATVMVLSSYIDSSTGTIIGAIIVIGVLVYYVGRFIGRRHPDGRRVERDVRRVQNAEEGLQDQVQQDQGRDEHIQREGRRAAQEGQREFDEIQDEAVLNERINVLIRELRRLLEEAEQNRGRRR